MSMLFKAMKYSWSLMITYLALYNTMFINTRVLIRNVQLERKANISEEGPACPMSPTPQLIADIQQVTCILLRNPATMFRKRWWFLLRADPPLQLCWVLRPCLKTLTSIKRLRIVMRCVGSRNVRFKKSRYAVWAYVTWDLIEDYDSQCGLTQLKSMRFNFLLGCAVWGQVVWNSTVNHKPLVGWFGKCVKVFVTCVVVGN